VTQCPPTSSSRPAHRTRRRERPADCSDSARWSNTRLHDARHTAATLLLQQAVPARVAMQILGHSQIQLTLGTYSHVVPELAQEAADRMGAALWTDGHCWALLGTVGHQLAHKVAHTARF